jgi:hypothetical protein
VFLIIKNVVITACLAVGVSQALAISKCKGPGGTVVFRDAPCTGQGGEITVKPAATSAQFKVMELGPIRWRVLLFITECFLAQLSLDRAESDG